MLSLNEQPGIRERTKTELLDRLRTGRYEAIFPGSEKYGYSQNEWHRTIIRSAVGKYDPTKRTVTLLDGSRKTKCNLLDNRTGRFVRVDYLQLVDDETSTVSRFYLERGEEDASHLYSRHRYASKVEARNIPAPRPD